MAQSFCASGYAEVQEIGEEFAEIYFQADLGLNEHTFDYSH